MRNPLGRRGRGQVRQKIIESAAQLFSRHGFAAVSIDDIMAGAGLIRGGFYSYFQSKAELYAEAITRFVDARLNALPIENTRNHAAHIIRDYLSLRHLEAAETCSPLIGLPTDLSQNDRSVRKAQESAVRMMVEIFEHGVMPEAQPARQRALALTALCVGGLALARAMEDKSLADELREAALAIAVKLGEWN